MHTIPPAISALFIGFALGWCAKWACQALRKPRKVPDWQPGAGDAYSSERSPGEPFSPPSIFLADSAKVRFMAEHNAWAKSAAPVFDDYKASGAGSWTEYLRKRG